MADHEPAGQSMSNRIIFIAYNVVWWLPIVLGLTRIIDYRAAFIALLLITILRAAANLYRNNMLDLEQAETFPLRSP